MKKQKSCYHPFQKHIKKTLILILLIFPVLTSCGHVASSPNTHTSNTLPLKETEKVELETFVTDITYFIGNKESKNFHKPTCSYLPAEKNQIRIPAEQIKSEKYEKYTPCGHCRP